MKVCLINNLYKPYSVGGTEKFVEEEARQLVQAGNEAVVITAVPFRGWKHRIGICIEDCVKVYRVWSPNIFWYGNLSKHNFILKLIWHFIDIFNFWSAAISRGILEKEKPDEVQTHNLMGMGCRNFQFPISNFQFKWIHYLHDVQLVEPSGVLPWNHKKDKLYQKIYGLIMEWRMGRPDAVVCLSEFVKRFYQERGFFTSSKWIVEKQNFASLVGTGPANTAGRLDLSVRQKRRKFLFVGSLVEHKGIRVLMQAWDSLCHSRESGNPDMDPCLRRDDISLYIVGDGILFDEVKKWAENYPEVKVHGRLEGEELEKIYQQSDVLVFPSICIENRPNVILEAKKYGLKIIASDTGGVREFLGGEDMAVEPGKAGALTKAIKCAII